MLEDRVIFYGLECMYEQGDLCRVGLKCSSHPLNTFTHMARNWSHDGCPVCGFNSRRQRCDPAALTTDQNAIPSGVVNDSFGFSHGMRVG